MKTTTKLIIRFSIALFIFIIVSTPLLIIPRRLYYKFLYPFFFRLYFIACKVRVHNLSQYPLEEAPPAIYASNHKSFVDFCIVGSLLTKPFTVMIKKEMTDNIFFKFIAWRMLLVPVKRDDLFSKINALERARKIISHKKYSFIIFPEGQYHFDRPAGNFKGGIAKLAKDTGVKIIPLAIYGMHNTFIHEKELVWKDVYIKSGEPLLFQEFSSGKNFLSALEARITSLYNELELEVNGIK